jgi:hypothetical protein
MRAAQRNAVTQRGVFLDDIRRRCGGDTPWYHIDFARNFAICAGVNVGPVSAIPSLTGTLVLGADGHSVSSVGTSLVFPVSDVTFPYRVLLSYMRQVDTGGAERICTLDDGTVNELVRYTVSTTDTGAFVVLDGGVQQANVTSTAALTPVPAPFVRLAARAATNSVQTARSSDGIGQLGTEDVSATMPASPTHARIGIDVAGTHSFTGIIRSFSIVLGAGTDGNLAAAAVATL